ncbi:UNKNOWN [Stylonychia lemnae]|uniref:Uncharacterized protein n=1 Tax=Stylonychia lemnae TaxID=5949 RepID=A0A078A9M0_STYLE|nr:UNKNOWN [Stylonychia lemnae]|eukprot:CDW78287.1 UNKNOWN [Stylonychia lemnae]
MITIGRDKNQITTTQNHRNRRIIKEKVLPQRETLDINSVQLDPNQSIFAKGSNLFNKPIANFGNQNDAQSSYQLQNSNFNSSNLSMITQTNFGSSNSFQNQQSSNFNSVNVNNNQPQNRLNNFFHGSANSNNQQNNANKSATQNTQQNLFAQLYQTNTNAANNNNKNQNNNSNGVNQRNENSNNINGGGNVSDFNKYLVPSKDEAFVTPRKENKMQDSRSSDEGEIVLVNNQNQPMQQTQLRQNLTQHNSNTNQSQQINKVNGQSYVQQKIQEQQRRINDPLKYQTHNTGGNKQQTSNNQATSFQHIQPKPISNLSQNQQPKEFLTPEAKPQTSQQQALSASSHSSQDSDKTKVKTESEILGQMLRLGYGMRWMRLQKLGDYLK